MGIQVMWENDERQVLLNVYEGAWNLDDFYAAVRETRRMMDSVTYTVGIIFDVSSSRTFPNGFMSAMRAISRKPHPNQGIMVIVGGNSFMRVFYDVFTRVYPMQSTRHPTYMAATYEEAHTIFAGSIQRP